MTTPFKPMKPRTPGSLHHALTRAINEVGGLPAAADLIQRQENWVYKAADPDVDERRKATLSYEEARTLTRSGATALAEDLALLAGGVFLPPVSETAPHALQLAVAKYAMESGEALAEIIRRAADGDFSQTDATSSLKEIDDALRALMSIRAIAVATAAGANVLPLRAAG
jgi:hypothetical protein